MKELIYLQFAFNTFFLVALWFLARDRVVHRRRKSGRASKKKHRAPNEAAARGDAFAKYTDSSSTFSDAPPPDLSSLVGKAESEELAAEAAFRRRLQKRWNQRAS